VPFAVIASTRAGLRPVFPGAVARWAAGANPGPGLGGLCRAWGRGPGLAAVSAPSWDRQRAPAAEVSKEGKQAGRTGRSRRTRSPRAPLAFDLRAAPSSFPGRQLPPRAPGSPAHRPRVPPGQRGPEWGRGSGLAAATLHRAPGTAPVPASGGEHPPAKLESYTAITHKTFIKSDVIFSSEASAFFFSSPSIIFLLVGSLSFEKEGKEKYPEKKETEKPPGTFIWALLISERLADFSANKFALKPY